MANPMIESARTGGMVPWHPVNQGDLRLRTSPDKGKSPRGNTITVTRTPPAQAPRRAWAPDCLSKWYRTSLIALTVLLTLAAMLEVYTFHSLKGHAALRNQCCVYGLLECLLATLFYFQIKSLKPQNAEASKEGIRV